MSATVTWSIPMTERTNDDDRVVCKAHWRVTAIENDFSASSYGTENFEGDPTASDFVAFSDLTEATVIGWVKDRFGAHKVAQIEAQLQAHIDEQKSPKVVAELPWASE